jgi:ABC-type Mn2+/Zn2+ transport system permease subunit
VLIAVSLAAILALGFLERRRRGLPDGRLGAAYVVSAALSILLLSQNVYGEQGRLDLLKGEVITVSNFDLSLTAVALAVALTVLIPALTARLFARTMRQFMIMASVLGGIAGFVGFWVAYRWDWPVGPADVVLLGLFYAVAWIIRRFVPLALQKWEALRGPRRVLVGCRSPFRLVTIPKHLIC